MGRHSEISNLEHEISECENAISDIESEEESIRRLQSDITEGAEELAKTYDMTASDEFRGALEEEAGEKQYQIYSETHEAQDSTSALLAEMAQAKERIHEHIEKCRRRIEQLKAEIEAEASSNAVM